MCWNHVLNRKNVLGHLKYPHLAKVVKTCLSCSHGNADSERSFSTNKHVVTAQRTCLAEDTVTAIRTVKDAVRFSGGSATDIVVTGDMLQRVRMAHSKFKQYRAEQKVAEQKLAKEKANADMRIKQAEESRKRKEEDSKQLKQTLDKLVVEEAQLRQKEQTLRTDLKTSENLLLEGNEKLKVALKTKNMDQIAVAQAMLEAGHMKIASVNAALHDIGIKLKKVGEKNN